LPFKKIKALYKLDVLLTLIKVVLTLESVLETAFEKAFVIGLNGLRYYGIETCLLKAGNSSIKGDGGTERLESVILGV
jgi:hypothetical protein